MLVKNVTFFLYIFSQIYSVFELTLQVRIGIL